MCKPSDLAARWLPGLLLAGAVGAACAGVTAVGGQVRGAAESAPARAAATARPAAAARDARHGWQLRCWQYGRLLFEEHLTDWPNDSRNVARFAAVDPAGRPLQLIETQTATCLLRAAPPADERRPPIDDAPATR
jgi:hypothetical protein